MNNQKVCCGTEAQYVQVFPLKPASFCKLSAGLGSTKKSATSLFFFFSLTLVILSSPLSFLLPQSLWQIWQELSSLSCTINTAFCQALISLGLAESRILPCSACGHLSQDTSHLILYCPATDSLRHTLLGDSQSLYNLWSGPWGVAQLLGLHGLPP